ncbi:MAG TPA: sensor histidine kinase [Anaerolineales bacterium]|nr:sensor histidine kinase [Anaerolineales bacterium]
MQTSFFALIYFLYGLAFFSMGLAILLELAHGSDQRLQHAFRPLAAFGLLHGTHEWLEMFENLDHLPGQYLLPMTWEMVRLAILAFSFLSLAAFGVFMIARDARARRLSLLVPLTLVGVWGLGLFTLRSYFSLQLDLLNAVDTWTRYILGVPSALLAAGGLIVQQREFRREGMAQFGRDSLWAAVAFAWYGLVGQAFANASRLPPSNLINQELFIQLFGFPVQLLRATAAVVASLFIMRVLRAFEVEVQRQIAALQGARVQEAERREALRGEMLRRIVAAQEAERQRIARELHDETGQALTAIGLGLRATSTSLRQDVEKAAHNLRQIEDLAKHSLVELQRLIADLRPSHLDDLGLAATLRWYTGEVQSRVSIQASVEVSGEERLLPGEVKTTLFRVVQEAITNVIKHSQARSVCVRLAFSDEGVSVQVEDDGIGFNPTKLRTSRPSWGLVGMEERAALLGGKFNLASRPGRGTRVEVFIPYNGTLQPDVKEDGRDENPPVVGR